MSVRPPARPELARILDELGLSPELPPTADQWPLLLARLDGRLHELTDAVEARGAFTAIVGHELRTPLGGVVGLGDLLLASELDDAVRAQIEPIARSARAALAIVDDLVDLAKLEAGDVAIRVRDVEPRRALAEAVEALRPMAMAKGLELALLGIEALPARARTDAPRLRQILTNLVSNAIKYTPSGEVRVEVSWDAPRRLARVAVHDTGLGVPEGAAERLFQRFSRVDVPTHARVGGTGLGLAIARGLIERLGGDIGYAPRAPAGSTFWFVVPLPPPAGDARSATLDRVPVATTAPPRGSRGRVLLAEDDEVNRAVARRMLEKLGFAVDVVTDGAALVRAGVDPARAPYVALVADLQMPVLDGLDATARIRRAEPAGVRVPIVAMTANAMRGDRERCLAAGMDDYVAKPVTLHELARVMDRWVPAAAPTPARAAPEGEELRLEALAGPGADPELLDELAGLFVKNARERVVAIDEAIAHGSLRAVRRNAHALRGSSVTIGAGRLAARAAWLEQLPEGDDAATLHAAAAYLVELRAELDEVARALARRGGR